MNTSDPFMAINRLLNYVRHHDWCAALKTPGKIAPCDCGLEELKKIIWGK